MLLAPCRVALSVFLIVLGSSWTERGSRPTVHAAPATSAADRTVIDGTFDIGDRSLYLRCAGSGSPTVLFESGSDGTSEAWGPIQAALVATTRTCAYDRANLGRSDSAAMPRAGAAVINDLHKLLHEAQVVGPYVLVGASLGGLCVRLYAQAYPEEVAGVVLLGRVCKGVVASRA